MLPKGAHIGGYRFPSFENSPPLRFGTGQSRPLENTTTSDSANYDSTSGSTNKKTKPSFHLLILASEANPSLCKTLLSAFILNYPPPILINFNKTFGGDNWDKASHTGKIRGVRDYLAKGEHTADDD